MEYRYKELSHIECYETRKLLPSEAPKLIKVGERYDDIYSSIEESVAQEDRLKLQPLFKFSWANYYKAKATRFSYGDYIGTASYIEAKNEEIINHYGIGWCWRPYIVIHFLDGTTTTKYFCNDGEMKRYINIHLSELNRTISK